MIERINPSFGSLGLVIMFINACSVRFAKAYKIDYVREYFDESIMSRFEEIGE